MSFAAMMNICRYCRLGCCSACSLITDTDNIQWRSDRPAIVVLLSLRSNTYNTVSEKNLIYSTTYAKNHSISTSSSVITTNFYKSSLCNFLMLVER